MTDVANHRRAPAHTGGGMPHAREASRIRRVTATTAVASVNPPHAARERDENLQRHPPAREMLFQTSERR